jgi:hypothetical protein
MLPSGKQGGEVALVQKQNREQNDNFQDLPVYSVQQMTDDRDGPLMCCKYHVPFVFYTRCLTSLQKC